VRPVLTLTLNLATSDHGMAFVVPKPVRMSTWPGVTPIPDRSAPQAPAAHTGSSTAPAMSSPSPTPLGDAMPSMTNLSGNKRPRLAIMIANAHRALPYRNQRTSP
jgi:hypothetical protein